MNGLQGKAPRFYYGWIIVALTFVTLSSHNTSIFSFGIFQISLIEEFGWSRGALGGALSAGLGIYAFFCPIFGSMLEKKGPRAIMPWGSIFIGAGLAAGYFVTSIWHVYLLTGLIIAPGLAMSGFSNHSAIMPRWFLHKRGRAYGIAFSGMGIAFFILIPAIERMIAFWGWRHAYLIFGLYILVILGTANFLFLRDRPEDVGQARDGLPLPLETEEANPKESSKTRKGVREVFSAVRGEESFWLLVLIGFIIGLNVTTVFSQMQIHLVDVGFGSAAAALILGTTGILRTMGSVFSGWLSDIIGRAHAGALAAGLALIGTVLLMMIPILGGGYLTGYLMAMLYGIGIGGIATIFASLAGDLFEGPSLGVIMGFLEISFALGGTVGPVFAGFAFDITGSYLLPFAVVGGAMLIAIFSCSRLHRFLKESFAARIL